MVERAALIATAAEAREYYETKLARAHSITCHGNPVTVVFEKDATHFYSEDPKGSIGPEDIVTRTFPGGRCELRQFSLKRARLMDEVLRAVSGFTVSVPGTGRQGHENRMLHGSRLPSGEYMRVVLRKGPGTAWTCVSAYAVSHDLWLQMRRAKRAKFPP